MSSRVPFWDFVKADRWDCVFVSVVHPEELLEIHRLKTFFIPLNLSLRFLSWFDFI